MGFSCGSSVIFSHNQFLGDIFSSQIEKSQTKSGAPLSIVARIQTRAAKISAIFCCGKLGILHEEHDGVVSEFNGVEALNLRKKDLIPWMAGSPFKGQACRHCNCSGRLNKSSWLALRMGKTVVSVVTASKQAPYPQGHCGCRGRSTELGAGDHVRSRPSVNV